MAAAAAGATAIASVTAAGAVRRVGSCLMRICSVLFVVLAKHGDGLLLGAVNAKVSAETGKGCLGRGRSLIDSRVGFFFAPPGDVFKAPDRECCTDTVAWWGKAV